MKNLTPIAAFLGIVLLVVPLLESCKRGPEDPFLSFRGRDARITGTWELQNWEMLNETESTISVSNDVNTNDSLVHTTYMRETTLEDGTMTEVEEEIKNTDVTQKAYDFDNGEWFDASFELTEISRITIQQTLDLQISIYKDNTYKANITAAMNSRNEFSRTEFDGYHGGFGKDTSFIIEIDTTLNPETEDVTEQVGIWRWVENTEKNKLMIDAGPLQGYLLQLKNKELILEQRFTYNDEETNTSGTDIGKDDFSTHNDDDPGEQETGERTTSYEEYEIINNGQSVWMKVDNDSKRDTENGGSDED